MIDNAVLDVVIGLVFIYCIYSLFATIINEFIATLFSMRARNLKYAIKRMLTDSEKTNLEKKLFDEFFEHPLIKYMSSGFFKRTPSYLSQENFSKTLLDILKKYDSPQAVDDEFNEIKNKLNELGKGALKGSSDTIKLINSFLTDSKKDLDKFKGKLEKWFNDTMDRASGWYKRQTQLIILFSGLVIAVAFNVNTFEIVNRLSKDKAAREQLVFISENYVKDHKLNVTDPSTVKRLDSLVVRADSLYKSDIEPVNSIMGLGWNSWDDFSKGFWDSILGCFVTALAISLGAPFWFDLLSKVVKLRGAGSKPPEDDTKVKNKSS